MPEKGTICPAVLRNENDKQLAFDRAHPREIAVVSPIAKSGDNPVVRMSQPFSIFDAVMRQVLGVRLRNRDRPFPVEGAQVILTDKVAFSSVHCLRTGPEIAFWRQSSE